MNFAAKLIHPYVLSGGSGTRLWPLSRSTYPKQFQPLAGELSILQQSCERVRAPLFSDVTVLCHEDHRFLVADQLQELKLSSYRIVLEPAPRNTAPAALVAALLADATDPDALVLLMPSDHVINDQTGFRNSVVAGVSAAKSGRIVTFGVKPNRPETGYGYIEITGSSRPVHPVRRFVEKPSSDKAEEFLRSGNFLWNSGIFLFSSKAMVAAFETHAPDMLDHCRAALEQATQDPDFFRIDSAAYERCDQVSIDYAIIEKVLDVDCVPLASDWTDLGSWDEIWNISEKDKSGNASVGDVVLYDTRDSYIRSGEGVCMALIGMDDVVAIATQDAILIAPKDRSQDVGKIVAKLKETGRRVVEHHNRVYRPWGWYEQRGVGHRFQVKYLMVKPGAKLSLQSHHHRAEHWVVVSGTAEVTVGDNVELLTENQSVYVPLGTKHRLANPGKIPALLVEIQTGAYLGEDDILRFADDFYRD